MRRIFLFLLLFAAVSFLSIQAKETLVRTAGELQIAWAGAQDGDVIICAPGDYNVSNKLAFPSDGVITLKSQYTERDSMATIMMNMVNPTDASMEKSSGIIFEYLNLQHNDPNKTSGHIIYLNKVFVNISQLVFRHCDISKGVRGLLRTVKPENTEEVTYESSGDLDYFEMTDCTIHDIFVTSGNAWPLIYLAHYPVEMLIEGNTFYDMPYLKHIFTMNYAETESGRNTDIVFSNNIVCTTISNNAYISVGKYLGEEATYTFENNIFVLPNWSNSLNLPEDHESYKYPAILRCNGGLITANNNVVQGPLSWESGESKDGDGEGGFLSLDVTNNYTMADVNLSWSDFADPENGDYSFLASHQIATAGVGGSPIGDPNWVRNFTNPVILDVTATIEDGKTTPRRAFYESGSEVSVKAGLVDGYTFMGWRDVADAVVSKDNPYNFTISANTALKADYQILSERNITISISGSNSANYTITPDKESYFDGDEVTISLNTHYINNFLGWSDGNKNLTRTLTVGGADVNLTANFLEYPYYVAWDFSQLTRNNEAFMDLEANFAVNPDNKGLMNYVSLGEGANMSTRNNKFTDAGYELVHCVARRTHQDNFSNPDYLYIEFSTLGLTGIKVSSVISTDNSIFTVQKMEYSLDGTTYSPLSELEISGEFNKIWRLFEGVLPAEAENQTKVWVRWIPDTSTARLFGAGAEESETEFCYIGKVMVVDSDFSVAGIRDVSQVNSFDVYAYNHTVFIQSDRVQKVEVFNVMGQKVKEAMLINGLNEIAGLADGVHLISIAGQTKKVFVK